METIAPIANGETLASVRAKLNADLARQNIEIATRNRLTVYNTIMAHNPGFTPAQIALASIRLTTKSGTYVGLDNDYMAESTTGYFRMLLPDGTLGPVQENGNITEDLVLAANADVKFLGVAPCNSGGTITGFLNYAGLPGGTFIYEPHSGIQNTGTCVAAYCGFTRAAYAGYVGISNSLIEFLDLSGLNMGDGTGFGGGGLSFYGNTRLTRVLGSSGIQWGAGIYDENLCPFELHGCTLLTTDAIYELVSTFGVSTSEYSELTIYGTACCPAGTIVDGTTYTAAQLIALAAAKNLNLTLVAP
jgi:hypothetical protein